MDLEHSTSKRKGKQRETDPGSISHCRTYREEQFSAHLRSSKHLTNIRELSLSTCEHVWKCNSQLTDWETEAELHYASYLAAPKSIEEWSV